MTQIPKQIIYQRLSTLHAITIIIIYSITIHALLWLSHYFGFTSYSYDIDLNAIWAKNFAQQLYSGEIYPRWLENINHGIGQPTFFYYSPFSFYIASIFYMPSLLETFPYLQVAATSLIATILSGISFLCWVATKTTNKNAVLASIFYISAYYHFVITVSMFQAMQQQWVFVCMPLIIRGLGGISGNKPYSITLTATSYFMLIISHIISALIFTQAIVIYILILLLKEKNINKTVMVCFPLLIGLSLSAVYIIPAIDLMPYIRSDIFTDDGGGYLKGFFFYNLQDFPTIDLALLFWSFASPLLSCFIFRKLDSKSIEPLFFTIVCWFSLFMCLSISTPIWKIMHLQYIQLPYRYLTLGVLALAYLSALYANVNSKWLPTLILISFLSIFIYCFLPTHTPIQNKNLVALIRSEWLMKSNMLAGYLHPKAICPEENTFDDYNKCFVKILEKMASQPEITSPVTDVLKLTSKSPRTLEISYNTTSETPLTIKRAYFHGNIAHTDKGIEIPLSYSEDGMITLTAPKGEGTITISLPYFKSEKIGATISLISLLVILVVAFLEFIRKQSTHA